MTRMQGLGFKSIMKNPALIPLYVCVGIGVTGAVLATFRAATRNPDVSWFRHSNPEPWQEYEKKQYKLFSPFRDYSKTESQAPKY